MIFCITLFQRAASRVKKRQSGAEDPRLRAACVNRVLCPLVARCRPAHVIGQHGQRTMRGRVAVLHSKRSGTAEYCSCPGRREQKHSSSERGRNPVMC